MLFSELRDNIQNLTNIKLTYEDAGIALNTSKQAIGMRVARKKHFDNFEVQKIKNYLENKFKIVNSCDGVPTVTLDYYPDIFGSCGTGEFVLSQEKQQIQVPDNVFFKKFSKTKQYSVINAYGDSMQPFIYSGDKLIVEHWNGEQIIDNQVYVFCYENEIFVKRLTKNINQLVIKSDNNFYDTIKLTGKDLTKIIIVGQIVGLMRDLR